MARDDSPGFEIVATTSAVSDDERDGVVGTGAVLKHPALPKLDKRTIASFNRYIPEDEGLSPAQPSYPDDVRAVRAMQYESRKAAALRESAYPVDGLLAQDLPVEAAILSGRAAEFHKYLHQRLSEIRGQALDDSHEQQQVDDLVQDAIERLVKTLTRPSAVVPEGNQMASEQPRPEADLLSSSSDEAISQQEAPRSPSSDSDSTELEPVDWRNVLATLADGGANESEAAQKALMILLAHCHTLFGVPPSS